MLFYKDLYNEEVTNNILIYNRFCLCIDNILIYEYNAYLYLIKWNKIRELSTSYTLILWKW